MAFSMRNTRLKVVFFTWFFVLISIFLYANSAQKSFAQTTTCEEWRQTSSSQPSCTTGLFQSDCNGSGTTTGNQCCLNIGRDSCQQRTVGNAPQYQFRCCTVTTPTPTPTLTPCEASCGNPTCVQCPSGSFLCGSTDTSLCFTPTPTPTPTPSSGPTCDASNCFSRSCNDAGGNPCQCYGTCSGNSCVTGGIIPGSCSGPPPRYSCTSNGCVSDPAGGYTTSNCNNACPVPTCPSPCNPNAPNFCVNNTTYNTCQLQSNGCYGFTAVNCSPGQTCSGQGVCVTPTPTPNPCPDGKTFCGGVCYDNTLCPYGFTNCSGAAQCLPSPTGPTITAGPTTPPPPPPPRCVININPNYSCVEPFMMSQSYMPYANGPTCNYEYWTFVNTCLAPPFRYIQPRLSNSCVGQKYGCVASTVTGFVFLDLNNNGLRDYGEAPLSSVINISAQYTPGPYKPAYCLGHTKNYCLANCSPFEWQGSVYFSSDCNAYCSPCDLPPDPSVVDPSTCTVVEIGDYSWTWCPPVTPVPTTQPQVSYPGGGSYRVSSVTGGDLLPGTYKVNYSLPSGFSSSEPPGAVNPSFSVIVGPGCSVDGSRNASCSGGSVANLNFGVSVINPWIQSTGNDIRVDAGFQNAVPAGASCGSYSSIAGAGGTSGVIYSGASSPSFGKGQASANNWIVGDPVNPETYSPTRPSLIRTSYSYLSSVAQAAAITPIDIASSCGSGGIANCNLSTGLANGLYIANGNLTLTGGGYSFPLNKNFVILVKGDLNIKEKIYVPNGSTATFSASGNITVDRAVGEASSTSTTSDIEGFYSADRNFIADGANNCNAGPDSRLNIAGTVVVNAALGGGTFQNNRSLCSGNNQCPVFSVIERPDFVLNAPEFIKHPSYVWQENAP